MMQDIKGRTGGRKRRGGRVSLIPRIPVPTKPRHFFHPGPIAGLLVAAFLFGLVAYLVLPAAAIKITPRTEPVTRDFELRVDTAQAQASLQDLKIPGQLLEQEIEGTKKASGTGSKNVGKKASGFVYIYNFSKNTLVLRAQTTVLTAGGKQYYFAQDVSQIRPTARIGSGVDEEIDETSLIAPVPIVAAEPGEGYNLPKSARLEIANEAFGSQPKILYALAADNISGGSTKQVKLVTAADITRGYAELQNQILEEFRSTVRAKRADLTVLDNAFTAAVASTTSSVKEDTEASEFIVTAKLKIKALGFSETEVRSVVSDRIKRLLPPNKVLISQPDKITSRLESVDLDKGQGILRVHFEGQIVYQIDTNELAGKLQGKTREEVREILLSRPEIEAVEVEFSPFWAKKAPKIQKRITIDAR